MAFYYCWVTHRNFSVLDVAIKAMQNQNKLIMSVSRYPAQT